MSQKTDINSNLKPHVTYACARQYAQVSEGLGAAQNPYTPLPAEIEALIHLKILPSKTHVKLECHRGVSFDGWLHSPDKCGGCIAICRFKMPEKEIPPCVICGEYIPPDRMQQHMKEDHPA